MRYFALFFFIVYILFAFLQLNDPDPVWWVTLYLVPASVSFSAFRNKYSFELLLILFVLYSSYAINSLLSMTAYEGFFMHGEGWTMKTNNQELVREVSGLAMCAFTFIIYGVYLYKENKRKAETNS